MKKLAWSKTNWNNGTFFSFQTFRSGPINIILVWWFCNVTRNNFMSFKTECYAYRGNKTFVIFFFQMNLQESMIWNSLSGILINLIIIVHASFSYVVIMLVLWLVDRFVWFFLWEGVAWLFVYCLEKHHKISSFVKVTLAQVIYKPCHLAVLSLRVWLLHQQKI